MHVLISVTAALLMQTPGVHISGLQAATAAERSAASQGAGASGTRSLTCPCPGHRRVS